MSSLLKRLVKKAFKGMFEQELRAGMEHERRERRMSQFLSECVQVEDLIGATVISVSNEVDNVTVGKVLRLRLLTAGRCPVPEVLDLVTKQTFIPLGIVMPFTWQKFDALNSLEPNARIALLYSRDSHLEVDKTATMSRQPMSPDSWKELVVKAINEQN